MKLCTFTERGGAPRPGTVVGGQVRELDAPDLLSALAGDIARVPVRAEIPLADVHLCAPVPEPPSVRDFYAFEEHVATARRHRGLAVPAEWYEIPVFYFSNPAAIYGHRDVIPYPHGSEKLDYELEVAAVIGADGGVAGFTIMNDWSARDLQRQEVPVGLGPAKGKDFATSLGPFLVTPDEFDGRKARMVARVNGEERSRGDLADLHHPWEAMLARASLNTRLRAGDIIGSGTVGSGCILEHGDDRWLRVGDVVELEVAGLGLLRNTVGPRSPNATV